MDRFENIPETALRWHQEGKGAVLATVVETWGSAPRRVGGQLVINRQGEMEGSVSGGCVEGAVVLEAIEALEKGTHMLLEYGVSDGDAFAVGLACSLIGTQVQGEFGPLVTWRIALGSGLAFLTAQLVDVSVFNALRTGKWWRAPLVSTLIGATLDTAIFFTIAFSAALSFIEPANDVSWAGEVLPILGAGPEAPLWVSLAVADWGVKLSLALLALIPFRIIVGKFTARVA